MLRTKLQEAAFDAIISQTAPLEALSLAMTSVTNSAVHAGMGSMVASITNITDEAHRLLELARRGPKTP